MRILVIDDSQIHLAAARQTLTGHDLTLVDNYDEAVQVLHRGISDYEAYHRIIEERGLSSAPYGDPEVRRIAESFRPPKFEAVLCDLLMPSGRETLAVAGEWAGELVPYGMSLALQAVLHGARCVAIVTATNHHMHPASAMLDPLGRSYWADRPDLDAPKFIINGAVVGYYHYPSCHVEGTVCQECGGTKVRASDQSKCYRCDGTGLGDGKDWGKVLERLLLGPEESPSIGG